MSNRERAVAMIDSFPDDQLGNVIAMLQTMKQAIEDALTADTPNAETIAAMREVNEMIRTGKGQHFQGSAEEFFAMLDAEDENDA